MQLKKHYLVEKRNVLNEMRQHNMTMQELRFLSIYLGKINPRKEETRLVRFALADFAKIMGLKRLDLRTIRPAVDSLLQKIVHVPNESGFGFTAFQLFKECRVDRDNDGEYFVEIDSHDRALPLFFEFKDKYFTYRLWNALRLKSSNQLRMYEILKEYEYLKEKTINLDTLKAQIGIKPNEYSRWGNFKQWVLDVCQEALKQNTDIKFEYEPIKVRNKVVYVKFFISKNENFVDPLSLDEFIELQELEQEPNTIVIEESEDSKSFEWIYLVKKACGDEFADIQCEKILDTVIEFVADRDEALNFLKRKYKDFLVQAEQNKECGNPIKHRYNYFIKLLKPDEIKEKSKYAKYEELEDCFIYE